MALARQARSGSRTNTLQEALQTCRRAFVTVGVFSFAINILMLASPIYMMQVYDRVLTTGHRETLLFLTMFLTVVSDLTIAIAVGAATGLALRLLRREVEPAEWTPSDRSKL